MCIEMGIPQKIQLVSNNVNYLFSPISSIHDRNGIDLSWRFSFDIDWFQDILMYTDAHS